MSAGELPERLSSDHVALILRRAAQLDAEQGGLTPVESFDPRAVEEAAREVGLSSTAVRQALAEVRAGTLPDLTPSTVHRFRVTGPTMVVEDRLVSATPEQVHAAADSFLRGQTFELIRRYGPRSVYRARHDLATRLRRKLDFVGTIKLEGVEGIIVTVSPLPPADGAGPQCMVRVEAQLQPGRSAIVATAAGSGGTLFVLGAATSLATGEIAPFAVLGPMAAGVGVGGLGLRRRWRYRRHREAGEVIASLLDSI